MLLIYTRLFTGVRTAESTDFSQACWWRFVCFFTIGNHIATVNRTVGRALGAKHYPLCLVDMDVDTNTPIFTNQASRVLFQFVHLGLGHAHLLIPLSCAHEGVCSPDGECPSALLFCSDLHSTQFLAERRVVFLPSTNLYVQRPVPHLKEVRP